MKSWPMQEAKARLAEVLKRSQSEGPQEVSIRGTPAAVVLSIRDYRRLRGRDTTFLEFLRASPLMGAKLVLGRDRSRSGRTRDFRLGEE